MMLEPIVLPNRLRVALVSPSKVLLPENRMVRIVTRDERTITGRILNQDGFSLQLIDFSSQLKSFRNRVFATSLLDQNPLPSYTDKMSAENPADLVHYLNSLKGAGAQ